MITLAAGRIQLNPSTMEEYVSTFYTFKIPHITSKTNVWPQGDNTGIYSESEITVNWNDWSQSQLDGQPTNLLTLYRDAFGLSEDDNDLSPLVGTRLNFFSSANLADKLPFELWIAGVNNSNKGVSMCFGDPKTGIFIRIMIQNMTKRSFGFQQYYICSNDMYTGDSIDNLLASAKSWEQASFSAGVHLKTLNVPPYAPLACYYSTADYTQGAITCGGMRFNTGYSTPTGMGIQGAIMPNLSRWANWYRMLKGTPFYGTPYHFDIPEAYQTSNGMKSIEFGIMSSQRQLDNGGDNITGTFNNSSSDMSMYNGTHIGKAYSYFCTGTNICSFFNLNSNATQQQYFAGGYIERKVVGSSRVQYSLKNAAGTLATFCGHKTFIETCMNKDWDWYGVNTKYGGVYLFVNNAYTSIPGGSWIREIPDDISHWTAADCPLFFATHTANNWMPFSYIDRQTMGWLETDCVGMCTNVCNDNKDYYFLMDQTTPMTKQFWTDLLEGFGEGSDINVGGGSIGGGTSSSGGGHGAFNDSSSTINGINDLINTNQTGVMASGSTPALLHGYKLTPAALNSFVAKCWDTSWNFSDIATAFGNSVDPMSAIISCKFCPFTVPSSSGLPQGIEIGGKLIVLDSHGSEISGLSSEIVRLSFGNIELEEYFGSYVDYDETKISIALPFVGIQEINARECMGGVITLDAFVDILDSSITYYLTLNKNDVTNVINTWRGVACFDLPLTGRDMHGKNTAIMGTISTTITSTAMGAVNGTLLGGGAGAGLGAIAGLGTSIASSATNYLSSRPSISRSGNFAGDRNSIAKAFLIIERPKLSLPENYAHQYGYPSNIATKMKYLEGFTVVGETHLNNMGIATQSEINEIESLLKTGVIF